MAQRYYVFECGHRSIEYARQKIRRNKYIKICPECGKSVTRKEYECERCGQTVNQRANQGGDDPKYCLDCSGILKREKNKEYRQANSRSQNHARRPCDRGYSIQDEFRFLDRLKTKEQIKAVYRNYDFVRSFTEKEKSKLRKKCEQILGEVTV